MLAALAALPMGLPAQDLDTPGLLLPGEAEEPERDYLSLAATPYLTPEVMAQAFSPLAERLAYTLNSPVRFYTNTTIDTYRQRLDTALEDIVLVLPVDLQRVLASGYEAVAASELPFKAYLVVPVSSRIGRASGLRNALVGAPPASSPITALALEALEDGGLTPHRDVFVKHYRTEEACLREMLRGFVDACATSRGALRVVQEAAETRFRVLAESRPLPGLAFAVHPRFSQEDRERAAKALRELAESSSGQATLRQAGLGALSAPDLAAYAALPGPAGEARPGTPASPPNAADQ